MKYLIALLLSVPTAYADDANFALFDQWARAIVSKDKNVVHITMSGVTPEGIPCKVYVTDKGFNDYYLSMGVGMDLDKDVDSPNSNYFGSFINPQSDLTFSDQFIDLKYRGGYIEGGKGHNYIELELKIELDEFKRPSRARGRSSLQPKEQICLI